MQHTGVGRSDIEYSQETLVQNWYLHPWFGYEDLRFVTSICMAITFTHQLDF